MAQVIEATDAELVSRLKLELELVKNENDNLRTDLFQVNENLKCSQANNLQLNSVITNLHNELQVKNKKIDENVHEKLDLGHMIETKNREISRLKDKITELNNSSFDRFEELNASLSNAKEQEIRLKFEEKVLQNEKVLYQKQIDLLGRQLEEKTNELMNLQSKFKTLDASMNEQLIIKSSEVASLSSENARLKSMVEEGTASFNEIFSKYQTLFQEHSTMKNMIDRQHDLHQKHSKYLQDSIDELKTKLQNEEQKCKDIQQLFEDQSKIHDQLEKRFNDMKSDLIQQNETLLKEIERMKYGSRHPLAPSTSFVDSPMRVQSASNENKFSQKESKYLQQIHELENENAMLSNQIRYLLKQDIESKGFPVYNGSQRNLGSNIRIPESEIIFSDIVQLQERNIELLKTLQIYYEDSETSALKDELELLRFELEEKKQQLEKSDSYSWERKNQELVAENKRLKNEFEQYKSRYEELKMTSFDDIRKIEEQKNALFEEHAILKANYTTLNAEYEMNKSSLRILETTKVQILDENLILRDTNKELTIANENLKSNAEILKEEVELQKKNVEEIKQKLSIVESQMDIHKNDNVILLSENSKLKEEVENIRNNGINRPFDQTDSMMNSEAKEILKSQIEELQVNNRYYREKIDRQEAKLSSTIQDFSNRIQKFQTILEKEKARYTQLQKEFFDLDAKYQELLEKNAQTKASITCPDEDDDPTKAAAHDIYRLKEMIKIAEDHAAANEKAKLQLENGIREMGEKHTEELEEMQRKIDAKQEIIEQMKSALLKKDDEIDAVAAKKEVTISQLREEIKRWKEEVDTLNNVAEVNHRSMEQILVEQEKMMLQCNGLRQLNSELQTKIDSLKEECERAEAALKVYKENSLSWTSDSNVIGINTASNVVFEKECANLKEYSDILLWQIEELKAKVSGNESFSSNPEDNTDDGLMKVVKFLREKLDEAQKSLRKAVAEINVIKVQNSNLNKEVEQLKNSMKKNNSNSMNEDTLKELYGKASLAEMLSAKNARLNIEFQRHESLIRTLKLKISRAEKYQDESQDLIQSAREKAIENQALKAEILNYKKRMAKLETKMSQVSVDTFEALCNEKEELEKKVQLLEPELNEYKNRCSEANKKYLMLKANLRAVETRTKSEKTRLENELANLQEEIKSLNAKFQQHSANYAAKSAEAIDSRIVALQAEVDRLSKDCLEKDNRLTALANRAKEKISSLASEKDKLVQELTAKQEECESLKSSTKSTTLSSTAPPAPTVSQAFDAKEGPSKAGPSTVSVAPVQAEVFKPPMASIKPTVAEPRASPVRLPSTRQTAAVTPNVEETSAPAVPQVVTVQPSTVQPNSSRVEQTPTQCVQVSEASTSFAPPPPVNVSVSNSGFTAPQVFDLSVQREKRRLEVMADDEQCSSSKKAKTEEEILEYSNEEERRAEELMASSEEEGEIHDLYGQQGTSGESNQNFENQSATLEQNPNEQETSNQGYPDDMTSMEIEQSREESADHAVNEDHSNSEIQSHSNIELPKADEEPVDEGAEEEMGGYDEEEYENDLEHEEDIEEDGLMENEVSADDEEDEEDEEDEDEDDDDEDDKGDDGNIGRNANSAPELIVLSDSEDDGHGDQNDDDNMPDDEEEDDEEDDEEEAENLVVDEGTGGNAQAEADHDDDGNIKDDDDAEQGQGISSSDANLNDPQQGSESQASSNALTTTTNDDGTQVQFQSIQPSISASPFSFASANSQFFGQVPPIFQNQQYFFQQQQQQPDSHEENLNFQESSQDRDNGSQLEPQSFQSQQLSQPQSVIISQSSAFVGAEDNDAIPSESGCSTDHSNDRNDVASSSTQGTQMGGPNSSGQDDGQSAQGSIDQGSSSSEADNSGSRGPIKARRGFRRGNYGF